MQLHFTCGHTRGGGGWQGGAAPPAPRTLSGDTRGSLGPHGPPTRLQAEREAPHRARGTPSLPGGWGGESTGRPTAGVRLRARWPLPPTCGGHPTPRHSRDRRGAPALPSRETNSGEGAPGPCAPAHAQARAEQGAAARAGGQQGGRRESKRRRRSQARDGRTARPQPHRGARAPGAGAQPSRGRPRRAQRAPPTAGPSRAPPARPPARRARGSPGGGPGDPGHTRRRRGAAVRGTSRGRTPRRGRGHSARPGWGPGGNPAP